jgi:hypothetical protein
MATAQKVKGGSNKKKGRNTSKCASYKLKNVRLTNKRKKVAKHVAKHPNDLDAVKSI